MRGSLLVPYSGDCPWRARAWAWCRARYEATFDLEIVEGHSAPEAWSKAEAVEDAATRARGDLLVVADADVWAENLEQAIAAVEGGAPWATPHRIVRRLSPAATDAVLHGAEWSPRLALARPQYSGVIGGGIVVLSRSLYEDVPLDRRFVGWGGEDHAWGWALETFAGLAHRERATLWHLWHPPQLRERRGLVSGSVANERLRKKYRDARQEPTAMRALVDGGR